MKGLVVVVLAALALGVGVLVTRGAGAQSGGEEQKLGDRFVAETAERLGVTPEELTEAMTGAQVEIIDQAVAEGRLTEEQAAKLKVRIEEYGPLSVIGRGHRDRPGKGLCHGARLVATAAGEVLGKEPAEVAEAVKSRESLAEQGQAQGMSVAEFKTALLDTVKRMLQAKVDEGKITQEQADRIFAGIEEHIDRIVNFEGQDGDGPCDRRDRPRDRQAETTPAQ
jgi:polyhydroxyalkanoate synthesis regulator phasin